MAVSFALDFVEIDILGMSSNHSKRAAYIALKTAKELSLSSEELYDIVALAILHDNGVSEKTLHEKFPIGNLKIINPLERSKEHCTIGEENIRQYPFLTDVTNVIKYHHENYDGTGYFNLSSKEIPLMSQIIHMADILERSFDLQNNNFNIQNSVVNFIKDHDGRMFSSEVVNAFCSAAKHKAFWMELRNHSIDKSLKKSTPQYSKDLSFEQIKNITRVFSKIIDSKSQYTQRHSRDLSDKAAVMADFYTMEHDEKMKLIIAADLHDIGKLAVPNAILDSPNKLSEDEFEIIKEHTYYTRLALQEINGFEEVTEWASNHHEKLNGRGYPFGKTEQDLDFNSRLMACLDIYQALTEERPYRRGLQHEEAMEILNKMTSDESIDDKITNDIDFVFGNLK